MIQDLAKQNNHSTRSSIPGFSGIIGQHTGMQEVFSTIRDVSAINVPVLIQGESGTGKEMVASAIHHRSDRADMPFVPVNCGALPDGLIESELFGHVKGSFTGALRDKKGRFELANGGTIFLDEVTDLSKAAQVKLLRVLETGKIERLGDEKTISVNFRLVCAANRNLKNEIKLGNFRDDLYYRINVVPINLPPLRERKEDIPLLVRYFIETVSENGQKNATVTKEALSLLTNYAWPGNVRELQSAIRHTLVKSKGSMIQPRDLPAELRSRKMNHTLKGSSRKLNYQIVNQALLKTGGNKAKAAKLLDVGRATIYRFLAQHPELV